MARGVGRSSGEPPERRCEGPARGRTVVERSCQVTAPITRRAMRVVGAADYEPDWQLCVTNEGVLHVGTWRTLRIPDRRLEGQGHL